MATVLLAPPQPVVAAPSRLRRFTVREFQRLAEVGILSEDDRCELIHGVIYAAMPPNPPHSTVLGRVNRYLGPPALAAGFVFRIQEPVALADSQPQPDAAVAAAPDTRYTTSHPSGPDLHLVVEVSDTSLAYDRGDKLELYAEAGVQVYWVVNIPARRVEVYTQPTGGPASTYQTQTDYLPGQSVPVVFAGQAVGSIPVSELFP